MTYIATPEARAEAWHEGATPPRARGGARDIGSDRGWAMVLLLTLLTVTSFVDRYVLTLLVADLNRDLHLTDTQFGVLVGPAFIISYIVVLFPVAALLDRWNRQYLIGFGMILWSAMTLASAWATSFEQLVALRAGLAIGEAVLAPAAISLIGDLFAPDKRRLPMIVIVAGSQVGVAAGALFGAAALQLAAHYHENVPAFLPHATWRLVFVAVGLLPLIVGTAYFLIAREPPRGASQAIHTERATAPLDNVRIHLRKNWPLYTLTALLTACVMLIGLSIPVWAPTFINRRFGASSTSVGYLLGSMFLIASVAGVFAFPVLVRVLGRRRDTTGAMLRIGLIALLFSPPLMVVACVSPNQIVSAFAFGLALFTCALAYPLPTQIVQRHTPPAARARVGAAMLLIMFLVSGGLGPVVVPRVALAFKLNPNSLGLALIVVSLVVAGVGASIWSGLSRWRSRRGLSY